MTDKQALFSAIGLCAKSGKAVFGTPLIGDFLHGGKRVFLVVGAMDVSDNTWEKLFNKCAFYGVPLVKVAVTMQELGNATGKHKPLSAIGIADENLAVLLRSKLNDFIIV